MSPTRAEIDLDAIAHNVRTLRALSRPALLCAVVKANGYGHGAEPVARAAVAAGADWLAVAHVDEAVALRDAGIDAPLLLLSEPRPDELDIVSQLDVRVTVYTHEFVSALAEAMRRGRTQAPGFPVHLKVDTGMRRVGAHPDEAVALAKAIAGMPELALEGVCTHCAVADEPDNPFTARQLERFDAFVDELQGAGIEVPLRHAANSAAAIRVPAARYELVRCGIAVYGIPPAPTMSDVMEGVMELRPALSLRSHVSFVKEVGAGEGISYGHHQRTGCDAIIATVPVGYADGVARSLPLVGGEVLIAGRRRRMIGVVTMDQLMVDCGPATVADHDVRPGDEVVLLGRQGPEVITPDDWAERLGTISYEVVCGLGPRVERRYVGGPPAA